MWAHNLCLSIYPSADGGLARGALSLPEEPWVCQRNPCGLLGRSLMTQYLEGSEKERRRVNFCNTQWERGGKQKWKEGKREEGGREEEEHKRLLMVMFVLLKSSQGLWCTSHFQSVLNSPIFFSSYLKIYTVVRTLHQVWKPMEIIDSA